MRGSPGSSGRSGSQGPPVSSFCCFFLKGHSEVSEWYPLSTEVWWSPNWPTLRWSYSLTDSCRLRVSSVRQPAQELGLIPRNNGWWSSQPIAKSNFSFLRDKFSYELLSWPGTLQNNLHLKNSGWTTRLHCWIPELSLVLLSIFKGQYSFQKNI